MIAKPKDAVATPSQTVGPFFHFGIATDLSLGRMAGPGAKGQAIRIRIRVFDGEGAAVPDAMIELWQADADGRYAEPPAERGNRAEAPAYIGPPPRPAEAGTSPRPAFTGYGRLPTDREGACTFETIRPGRIPDPAGGLQAAHVNVCLFARGLLRQVHTRIYFEDDAALAGDPVLTLIPEERRATLLARPMEGDLWQIDLRLQGDRETVFLDI